ncbi:Guanine nucleotide-binding protein subunit gamma [Basidiobolus ranarum]|uniref:Guanine nucleotide-binding protein subunit gamma n=1 Tax=Basidiobolus ranarum TaxID=34480 RepID=A0ABR2WWQ8_9FUNG
MLSVSPSSGNLATPVTGLNVMSEHKLRKMMEYNNYLKHQLDHQRIPTSQASHMLIKYVTTTRDYLVPSVWGTSNTTDLFAAKGAGCECNIM